MRTCKKFTYPFYAFSEYFLISMYVHVRIFLLASPHVRVFQLTLNGCIYAFKRRSKLSLESVLCYQWTIPQLDKVLNWKTILAQLERAS